MHTVSGPLPQLTVQVEVVTCSAKDIPALVAIGRQTFTEAYAHLNTPENMAEYMNKTFTAENLGRELNQKASVFYKARVGGEVTGYLKVNYAEAQTDLKDPASLEIERIYVAEAWHGRGIGKILLDKAITVAREARLVYIWLGVWEKNPKAIAFYRKQGFEQFDTHNFVIGDDVQTDFLMKKQL
jgi:diamine N-acetyltransferase